MILKLSPCQWFIEFILEFKRGRACHQQLDIREVISDSLQGHTDILHPLSLIYDKNLILSYQQFQLLRIHR